LAVLTKILRFQLLVVVSTVKCWWYRHVCIYDD